MAAVTDLTVGAIVHGFCGGYFGRDSYSCRRVEAVGPDWVVTRNGRGGVELGTDLRGIAEYADDRFHCGEDCFGPLIMLLPNALESEITDG